MVSYTGLCEMTEIHETHHGVARSLCAKLSAAKEAEERGNTRAKAGALDAYCDELKAQADKTLTQHHALGRVAAPAIPVAADFKFTTCAYPNPLNNIAIRGRFAFVPNTGASPNGPTRFDVNTESLLHVLDLGAKADAGKTINMHSAVAAQ